MPEILTTILFLRKNQVEELENLEKPLLNEMNKFSEQHYVKNALKRILH
jgi:hypothetical protein